MLLKKEGFPEDEELVLCTVTAVQNNSVFVKLDEYDKTGMIHISEIAPGRIRNIREFVEEGKKVVCKVLRVDKERGYIDLSLRRVNESQHRKKINETKQEMLAEKIVEHLARQRKEEIIAVYKKIRGSLADWPGLFPAFEAISKNELDVESLEIDTELAKQLKEAIADRIVPPEVKIEGDLKLSSYASDGVLLVKEALARAAAVAKNITIAYKGAGTYRIIVKTEQFKEAEKYLKEAVDKVLAFAKEKKFAAEFKRLEGK
jgi:translation initiation factor 2 subunit 1